MCDNVFIIETVLRKFTFIKPIPVNKMDLKTIFWGQKKIH